MCTVGFYDVTFAELAGAAVALNRVDQVIGTEFGT